MFLISAVLLILNWVDGTHMSKGTRAADVLYSVKVGNQS